jgi:iron complex transport system substrate-binding protein
MKFTARRFWLLLLASLLAAMPAMAKPLRIASLNLCSDQLLMMLVEPSRIVSLSHFIVDPRYSFMTQHVGNTPINHGDAEEIIPLKPDLVLAGRYSAREGTQLLRRLGYNVVVLDLPQTLAMAGDVIRSVATAVDEAERGEQIIAAMELRKRQLLARVNTSHRPKALIYAPNGFTSGTRTMNNEVLEFAGYRNIGAELGITGFAQVPLERVLLAKPQYVIFDDILDNHDAQAYRSIYHPVWRRIVADSAIVPVPANRWNCAGPQVLDAVEILIEART